MRSILIVVGREPSCDGPVWAREARSLVLADPRSALPIAVTSGAGQPDPAPPTVASGPPAAPMPALSMTSPGKQASPPDHERATSCYSDLQTLTQDLTQN